MPNQKPIAARIGPCRSGISFDVPHELEHQDVDAFLKPFCLDELVDIFCMTEAVFSRYRDSLDQKFELTSLYSINDHIRCEIIMAKLENRLEVMGLVTSPKLVQHGLTLLLG